MSNSVSLEVKFEPMKMTQAFVITGYVFDNMPSIVVTLTDKDGHKGRGEAAGVYFLDDRVENMTAVIETVRNKIESGISRDELQTLLPPGGARNALDCAMWELEASQTGKPVWELAGLSCVKPLITTMTLGADTPEAMVKEAKKFNDVRALKLKLTGEPKLDGERVKAVRAAFPECWIGIDANQGYTLAGLKEVMPAFVRENVKLIEQPLPRGDDHLLQNFSSPIPLAADESILCLNDVDALVGKFDVINIKLDKCGGLTEGLAIAEHSRSLGLDVMVGNMGGSSFAMAPAFIVGQFCDVVDLDGPIALIKDRKDSVKYIDGYLECADNVWGDRQALGNA